MRNERHRVWMGLVIGLFLAPPILADDWPAFRGPARNGVSSEPAAPTEWGRDKNIKWKVKLPAKGNSSPIVTGDKVLLACAEDASGAARSLYCFDRGTGNKLWVQTVTYNQKEPTHATNPYAGSTPVTDGKVVVVWHGSASLHCYDLSGKKLWNLDTGPRRHIWGYGASPIIHEGTVYLNCGPGDGHHVIAVNLADGKILWDTPEPRAANDKSPETKGWLGSWSSPMVVKVGDQHQLLIFQSGRVVAYDLKSGKPLWSADGAGPLAYTDVMISPDGKTGVALAGYGGAAIGFSLDPASPGKQLWRTDDKPPQRIGSGIIVGSHLYLPSESAIQCIDITSGKIAWSHRLQGASYWASLVSVAGRCYAVAKGGSTIVFTPDPTEFKLVAENKLGESSNATMAPSNGQLFLRTDQHLYCIQ